MTSYSRPNHPPLHSFEYVKGLDIVNFYTFLFLYDHLLVVKSSNFILPLIDVKLINGYSFTETYSTLNSVVNEGYLETFSQIISKLKKLSDFSSDNSGYDHS